MDDELASARPPCTTCIFPTCPSEVPQDEEGTGADFTPNCKQCQETKRPCNESEKRLCVVESSVQNRSAAMAISPDLPMPKETEVFSGVTNDGPDVLAHHFRDTPGETVRFKRVGDRFRRFTP